MKSSVKHTLHNNSYTVDSPYSEAVPFHLPENSSTQIRPLYASAIQPANLLTEDALSEIKQGNIPDLRQVCRELADTFIQAGPHNALQFIPVFQKLTSIDPVAAMKFMQNEKTNHVLVKNTWMKLVLIHWKPGKVSSIHGHPKGGCVFKVLQGKLEEKRYSSDQAQSLLATSVFQKGSMAYIDDQMAYHAVANPFEESAISIHVYTPGIQA